MKYKIWDKLNGEYLDLTKYCVNGFGNVMTIKGDIFINQQDFEIEVQEIYIRDDELDSPIVYIKNS